MGRTQELIELAETNGAHNYLPLSVVLCRGEGAKVWDVENKEYLDFLSCYSALNFGHQNPHLVEALIRQAKKLSVTSRAFHNEPLCYFLNELTKFSGLDVALPMNSGTEAVETALKMVRKWGKEVLGKDPNRSKILAMKNNFHGRSIAVLSFSTEALYRDGFGPFTPGFSEIEFGNLEALEDALDDDVIGVLMEPIQAEAGILIPPAGYLKGASDLCRKKGIPLMLDEIQTGLGRTGRDFCFQHDDIVPDVLILGKSLGGGLLPLSAVIASRELMQVMTPGVHGSTFGGNPLACAVGSTALKLLESEKLSERSQHLGALIFKRLTQAPLPRVKEVRGKGSLIGIELEESAGGARKYCERLAERGVLCKETHENVIRLAPPLTILEKDLLQGVEKVIEVINEFR